MLVNFSHKHGEIYINSLEIVENLFSLDQTFHAIINRNASNQSF